MKKRFISVVLGLTLIGSLLAGCGGKSENGSVSDSSDSDAQKTEQSDAQGGNSSDIAASEEITVWTQLTQEEIDNYIEDFNAVNPNIKVNAVVYPSDSYMTKLNAVLRSGTGVPDVFLTEVRGFGDIKETDFAENLSQEPYNADELNEDFVPYVAALNTDSNGHVKGLSYQSCPGGFWYNKKLAKEYLGTDDPDELAAMLGDWDAIAEVAGKVYEKSGGQVYLLDSPESIRTVMLGSRTEEHVVDGTVMHMDLYEDILKVGVKIRENHGDAMLTFWDGTWATGFYENQNFILTGLPSWGLHYAIKANTPSDATDTDDSWGFCQAPSAYHDGGTWLSIASASKNKEAAWEFVKTLTSSEDYLMRYVERTGDMIAHIPTIEKIIDSDFRDPFTGDQDIYQYMYDAAMRISEKDITKYDTAIESTFLDKLKLAMAGEMTVEEAMEAFKSDVKTQFPELTVE